MMNDNQINEAPESALNDPAETQPNVIPEKKSPKAKKPWRLGFWLSLLVLLVALGLGGFAGYGQGVSERVTAQTTLVAQQLGDQFALVQPDIDAKRYSVARQRLEFIIAQNPNFPGAAGKLAEVMVQMAITPSPVPTETPTLTPTPDLRGQEAILAQAQQQLNAKDWTGLMGSLDSLRKADPTYKAALVDSMYYTALRNRGADQILGAGAYKISNLEGGIYDLTLAERFGPLDGYADGLRNFARMYITGASFWDVNWPQAVNYFRQVYQFAPNLRDSSNVTAGKRLYLALLSNGDQLASIVGKSKDRCTALNLWNEASNIAALDATYQAKFNALNDECNPPTPTPDMSTSPEVTPDTTPQ
jgi:hypothetical protein